MNRNGGAQSPVAGPRRLDALTVLRFIAAIWVLGMHLENRLPLAPSLSWGERLVNNGAYAMTLFFVLSGTVLAYGNHRLRPVAGEVIAFYQARLARIYAPYTLIHLVALCWVAPTNAKELTGTVYITALSLLGLQAWFPFAILSAPNSATWSISVEFFFYALFPALLPLIAWLRGRWGTLRLCAYLSAASGLIGLADYVYPNGSLFYFMPTARLPELMIGLALGLELLQPDRRTRGRGLTLGLAGLLALAAALNPALDYGLWIRANLFVVPTFAWLIYELARWDQRRATGAHRIYRPLLYLGEVSYCLFLAQIVPLLWLGAPAGKHWLAEHAATVGPGGIWLLVGVLSLAGAIFLHEFIEKPARRFYSAGGGRLPHRPDRALPPGVGRRVVTSHQRLDAPRQDIQSAILMPRRR